MPQNRDIGRKERADQKRDSNRDWDKTYDESDLKHVLEVSHARNWNDAIRYLDEKGMSDNELTPGETIRMKEDLQKTARSGGGFIGDPQRAYNLIHRGGKQQQSKSAGKAKGGSKKV